jgi:uncharacterized protein (DUF697 family)
MTESEAGPRPSASRELVVLPATRRDIDATARTCRKLVTRRALVSAGAAVVPVPGIDVAVDFGLLVKMLTEINEAFGLTPEQIENLAPRRRLSVQRAVSMLGGSAVGRAITRQLVAMLVKRVAARVATKQVTKYVPIAGQAVAAGLSFTAIKLLGDRHVADCIEVAERVRTSG